MASKPISETVSDDQRIARGAGLTRLRWPMVLIGLIVVGWLWPYDPVAVPDRVAETGWLFGWLTALVLLGGFSGYLLRTRWAALLVPLMLYAGGVIRWLQFDWGLQQPSWEEFLPFSAAAVGVLFVVAGIPAGIACRVVSPESTPFGRGSGSVRLSAAFGGLLALLSITTIVLLPIPYLGGLLGFAAILAAISVLQEGQPNRTERVLAIASIALGTCAAITQIYELWGLMQAVM